VDNFPRDLISVFTFLLYSLLIKGSRGIQKVSGLFFITCQFIFLSCGVITAYVEETIYVDKRLSAGDKLRLRLFSNLN